MIRSYFFLILSFALILACEKETPTEPILTPEISCGTNWTMDCIDSKWVIQLYTNDAKVMVSQDGYNGYNSLLLYNPHDSLQQNPPFIRMTTFLNNIKPGVSYKISYYSKIRGFPDFLNMPDLWSTVFGDGTSWYNDDRYYTPGGIYHFKDWSEHSFIIIGRDEPTINFQLLNNYDSTWISNLRIQEM